MNYASFYSWRRMKVLWSAHGKWDPITFLCLCFRRGNILHVELFLVMILLYLNNGEFSGSGHYLGLCLMLVWSEMTVLPLAQIWPIQFVPYSPREEVLVWESISILDVRNKLWGMSLVD